MSQNQPTSDPSPLEKPATDLTPEREVPTLHKSGAIEPTVVGRPPSEGQPTPLPPTMAATVAAGGDTSAGNADAYAFTTAAPRSIGPYQILEKLGEGGMGAVYKARHTRLDKMVALKILPAHLTCNPDALARFEREMKAVGRLEHPGIVRATDAGDANGTHYLAMELVDGQDVHQYLAKRGKLPVNMACRIIRQAASALSYAHEHGLVHRDIKPSNLFLTKSGQVKVLDLGLARLSQDDRQLTSAGNSMGTPDYMAPEQWDDSHSVDHRCDLYSLGCTLFQLLVGRPPYADEAHRTLTSKMKAHAMKPIPDLRALRPDVPVELAAIYTSLMAKEVVERFESAKLLAERLVPFCRTEIPSPLSPGTRGERDGVRGRVLQSASVELPVTEVLGSAGKASSRDDLPPTIIIKPIAATAADKSPPRRRSRTAIAAAGGAAALFLLGVIIITITNKDGTQTKIEVPGDAQNIEVTQDGKSIVKAAPAVVSSETAKSQAKAKAPIADANRAAAEALLPYADLALAVAGERKVILADGTLPSEPFALTEIEINRPLPQGFTEQTLLPALRPLRSIQSIRDAQNLISASGGDPALVLQELSESPAAKTLEQCKLYLLANPPIIANQQKFPRLKQFRFGYVSDEEISYLSGLNKTIEHIEFYQLGHADDGLSLAGLKALATLPMKELTFDYSPSVKVQLFEALAESKTLTALNFGGNINNQQVADMSPLADIETLRTIRFIDFNKGITEAALEHLHTTLPRCRIDVNGREFLFLSKIEKQSPPVGKTVDVLALIDPNKHARNGTWLKEGSALVSPTGSDVSVELPIVPTPAYRLELTAERLAGGSELLLGLPIGRSEVLLLLEKYFMGTSGLKPRTGFDLIDYVGLDQQSTFYPNAIFSAGKAVAIVIEVTPGRIWATCDGKTVADWEGDSQRLSVSNVTDRTRTSRKSLFIATWQSSYRINKLTYTAVAAPASADTTPLP